jgi:hypothetical protein
MGLNHIGVSIEHLIVTHKVYFCRFLCRGGAHDLKRAMIRGGTSCLPIVSSRYRFFCVSVTLLLLGWCAREAFGQELPPTIPSTLDEDINQDKVLSFPAPRGTIAYPEDTPTPQPTLAPIDELKSEPDPTPFPLEALKSDPMSSVLVLELEHAIAGYSLEKSLPRLERIITAYERLIERTCFAHLFRDLTMKQEDQNTASCIHLRKMLLALHPYNAHGICANSGFEDPRCASAVTWIIQRPGSRPSDEQSLGQRSSTKVKQVAELRKALQESRKAWPKDGPPTDEQLVKAKALGNKLLTTSCSDAALYLEERVATFKADTSSGSSAESSQVSPEPNRSPSQAIKKPIFVRVRRIGELCKTSIEQVRVSVDNGTILPCALFGFYTPQCITSIKEGRKEVKKGGMKNSTPQKEAFDTF